MGSIKAKFVAIKIIGWIDVATYSFLLLFGIRNTVKILVQ